MEEKGKMANRKWRMEFRDYPSHKLIVELCLPWSKGGYFRGMTIT
jgi:hypothetical protein